MIESYRGLDGLPADSPPCAVTIGNFDGIHKGHQAILKRTVERARTLNLRSAAMIFDPHPMRIVRPENAPLLLSSPGERVSRFGERGIDEAVILPFTERTAALTPERFVREVLVERLHARAVVVGENFRFGHRQTGDFATLLDLGPRFGFEAEAVPPVMIRGEPASSTRVRDAASRGDLTEAEELLGRPFTLEGQIVRGYGVGSSQTVPTLNLAAESELLPRWGVYVTLTRDLHSGRQWKSITNIGKRPTFNGSDVSVETHVLDEWRGDAPARIRLAFHLRLRDEQKFPSAEHLKEQIRSDVEEAWQFFQQM